MTIHVYTVPAEPLAKQAEEPLGQVPVQQPEEPLPPPPQTASEGVHPFAISPEEGLPLIPQEQLVAKLQKLAAMKNGAVLMYTTYADALRTPFRDSLVEHFTEHASEERAGAYDFNMKVIALGGQLSPKVTKPPDAGGVQDILVAVIQFEKSLIKATRDLLAGCGEYDGLRLLLEDSILKDQRHLDDARRMLVSLP